MKLFVAACLASPSDAELEKCIAPFRARLSDVLWVPQKQFHVTVKYLGEIRSDDLLAACRFVDRAAGNEGAFFAEIGSFGTFPKNKPPRVLWAGIDEGVDAMTRLREQLDSSFEDLGVPRENRQFRPHVTLGRVKRSKDRLSGTELQPTDLEQMVTRIPDDGIRFQISELQLMASVREGGRPQYEVIHSADLA
ncbi:MAG: RNA 2',3'-cyclic phosphodiesterase [Pirellulaceae bacterium]